MTDILIIEDNNEIAELLSDFLIRDGYSCQHCRTGEAGIRYIKENQVRLVLLDIMLPGMDGLQVCDLIYRTYNIPTIILSARTAKDDKLSGLQLGADDYIEKPYDPDLLLAKIQALYRRYYQAPETVLRAGGLKLDPESHTVYLNEIPLTLTLKEFQLLLLFMKNQGKVLRKEYLFNSVWGADSFSEPATLTVHVKWLREKIESNPKKPEHLLTVWGVGYKFI